MMASLRIAYNAANRSAVCVDITSTPSPERLILIRATEINDFGYPQNSEIDTLKTYITTESIMSTATAVVRVTIFIAYQQT